MGMFVDCVALKDVEIPSGVTFIESSAFQGCFALSEIALPTGLKTVDYGAFENCTALTAIRYGGTAAQWEKIDFRYSWNSNTGEYTVYCADGTVAKAEK